VAIFMLGFCFGVAVGMLGFRHHTNCNTKSVDSKG
jgi:hypothetical protein